MISVKEAESLISTNLSKQESEKRPLTETFEQILREDIIADHEYPPFDRVAMDGIAIRWSDFTKGLRSFHISGVQRAGEPAQSLEQEGACLEVMTGSVLPQGADCVIRYEDLEINEGEARLKSGLSPKQRQNIHTHGSDYQASDVLATAGQRMTAPLIGIAASVGLDQIHVSSQPRISVVSTGDELVEIAQTPKSHQIRRSNSYAIQSALMARGYRSIRLHHLIDEKDAVHEGLKNLLSESDVVILSGAVSKGKFDLIPGALADLQVENMFHGILQRPGKPMWFGRRDGGPIVFGLPGNPVSTLTCCFRYVLPALDQMCGLRSQRSLSAHLGETVQFTKPMTYFVPVRVIMNESAELIAHPVSNNGSGDFAALSDSDGFIELPPEPEEFLKGGVYPLYMWRSL